MSEFLTNRDWKKNPKITPGDIAILRFEDGFLSTVKSIVTHVASEKITAHVEAVFDSSKNEISSHELTNKKLHFGVQHVFEVIKKTEKAGQIPVPANRLRARNDGW